MKKNSGVRLEDFPKNSLLHQVAKVNVKLAYKLAEEYGGTKVYICQPHTIKRAARNRQILKRASVCEGHNRIANDLGLTGNYVRRLIVADIKAFWERTALAEIPE